MTKCYFTFAHVLLVTKLLSPDHSTYNSGPQACTPAFG